MPCLLSCVKVCLCFGCVATHKIFEKSFTSNLSSQVCSLLYTERNFDSIPYFHGHKSHLFIHSCMLRSHKHTHTEIDTGTKIMYYNNNNGCFVLCMPFVCISGVTPFKTVVGKIVSRKIFTITFISIYFPCVCRVRVRCLLLKIEQTLARRDTNNNKK